MATFYLLRHGEIEGANQKRLIGQIDLPLNPEGRYQAEQTGRHLSTVAFSEIWCSDLNRTVETAQIVSGERNQPIQQTPELREIALGEWDGLEIATIRDNFSDLWIARGYDIGNFCPPGGESFFDLQQRVVTFIQSLVSRCSGNVLITTHAGVIRTFLCHILQAPLSHLFRIHLDYCGLTLVEDVRGELRIKAMNLVLPNHFG